MSPYIEGAGDQQWLAWIGDAARSSIHQSKLVVCGAQEHDAAITGHVATVKAALYDTSAQAAQFDGWGIWACGTVWHRQSSVEIGVRYQ